MPEQMQRKKWNKPQLIALGKYISVEEIYQRIDQIKQTIRSAQQIEAQTNPSSLDAEKHAFPVSVNQ